MRTSLRAKLVKTMIATVVAVSSGTLLAVAVLDVLSARQTLRTIETHIQASIQHKGRHLVGNQALALRDLVADNAFGDVARMVERTVEQDDQLVYGVFFDPQQKVWALSSRPDDAATDDWRRAATAAGSAAADGQLRRLGSEGVFAFSAGVVDDKGTPLGTLRYALSDRPLQAALAEARTRSRHTLVVTVALLALLAGIGGAVGVLRSRRSAARITRPVGELTWAANQLASGRRDIRVSIASGDELELLGNAFNEMASELAESYARLEQVNRTLEAQVEARTHELARRNRDMRLVLDNVTQGFLTLSRTGELALERSGVIDRWFGAYPPGTRYVDFVQGIDRAYADRFALAYEALVEEVLPRELCLEQLPTSLSHGRGSYRCAYLPLVKADTLDGLLVVISDVTHELALARQEAERRELLAVFEALARDRAGFLAFVDEADELLAALSSADRDGQRRLLHTLKGNAGMMGLELLGGLCGELEDGVAEAPSSLHATSFAPLEQRWHELTSALARFTGDQGRDVVALSADQLDRFEHAVRTGCPPAQLLEHVAAWKLEPVERPLRRLGRYATALAARLGKGELVLDIRDHGIRLDPKPWAGVWASLVHVVRNAVDHGLEAAAEREHLGKGTPRLRLTTRMTDDHLYIEVEDDGRGVDWASLAARAAQLGLPHESPRDLHAALFDTGLSTRAAPGAISGRGVGLAALRDATQAMQGELALCSQAGGGTRVTLAFPVATLSAYDDGGGEDAGRMTAPAGSSAPPDPTKRHRQRMSDGPNERLGEILASCLSDLVLSLDAKPVRLSEPPPTVPQGDDIAAVASFGGEGVRGSVTLLGVPQVFEQLQPVPDSGGPLDLADWARELANQAAGRLGNRLLSYDLAVAVGVPQSAPAAEVCRSPSTQPTRVPVVFAVSGPVLEAWLEIELPPGFELRESSSDGTEKAALEGDILLF